MKKWDVFTEWTLIQKKESRYESKRINKIELGLLDKLEDVVPDALSDKLEAAFVKSFEVVFGKGTSLVEKTYSKDKYERKYKVNSYIYEIEGSKENYKAFVKKAKKSGNINKVITGLEGMSFGALGVGIPDIPVFLGVLLRSVYEVALSFGFSYKENEEKVFIMKIIKAALCSSENFKEFNSELNDMIDGGSFRTYTEEEIKSEIKETAKILSEKLLYLKFIQGIPLVGIVGGLSDFTCNRAVNEYAILKYQRRFLKKKMIESE